MATPTNIPSVSYNTYFGNVGKVVWFEVSENFNYFELNFNLTLQRTNKTNIQIYNNLMDSVVWENTYPEDVNQSQYLDYVRILNTPIVGTEQPMGLLNLPV
jgi:hypothetical protein